MKNKQTVFMVVICLITSQHLFLADKLDKQTTSNAWYVGKYSIAGKHEHSESDSRKLIAAAGGFKGKQRGVKKSSLFATVALDDRIASGLEERAAAWRKFQAHGPKANKFGLKH